MKTDDIASAVLNELSRGVVVVDGELQILSANEMALRHFRQIRRLRKLVDRSDLADIEELFRQDEILRRALFTVEGLGRKIGVRPFFAGTSEIADVYYDLKRLESARGEQEPLTLIEIREQHRSVSFVRSANSERRLARAAASVERRHAQQLDAVNRNLNRFAHAAAHDMQEPVRIISNLADALLSNEISLSSERQDKFLNLIRLHAQRARALVRDILEFSEVKDAELQLQSVDIAQIARRLWREMVDSLPADTEKALHIGELPILQCDRRMIEAVFRNLFSNSIKYRRDSSVSVVIDADSKYNKYNIRFVDFGVGFDPSDAEQIFEPFVRLQRQDKIEGAGVGLSLCRSIIERHQGRISAVGHPGTGSEFHIELPLG